MNKSHITRFRSDSLFYSAPLLYYQKYYENMSRGELSSADGQLYFRIRKLNLLDYLPPKQPGPKPKNG